MADFRVTLPGGGPALDGFDRPQARLANVSFDLSQPLGQGLQLSLAGLPQLITNGASQDDQAFVVDRLTVVTEGHAAASSPVLGRLTGL